MTPHRQEALDLIEKLENSGEPARLAEISRTLHHAKGWSYTKIDRAIKGLMALRLIEEDPDHPRSVRTIRRSRRRVTNCLSVGLVRYAADRRLEFPTEYREWVSIDLTLVPLSRRVTDYAVVDIVRIDPADRIGLRNGDRLLVEVVRGDYSPPNGRLVLAEVEGRVFLRAYVQRQSGAVLRGHSASNDAEIPITAGVRVLARVVACLLNSDAAWDRIAEEAGLMGVTRRRDTSG